MATKNYFDGQAVYQPGSYSVVESNIVNPPITSDYSTVLFIDTGIGAGFGGGSGITGELENGKHSVYRFTSDLAAQAFVSGGAQWKIIEKLFNPINGSNGISQLYYVRAATTTSSALTYSPTGGGAAGGTFILNALNEGLVANGVEDDDDKLVKGYAFTIVDGTTASTWQMKLWKGTWKGNYSDGVAFDEITQAMANPILLATSPEYTNVQTLLDWADTDTGVTNYFELDSTSAVTGTGVVDAADATTYTGNTLAAGGTETYNSTDMDAALAATYDIPISAVLCDKYGTANYTDTIVDKLLVWMNKRKNVRMFYGGGKDETEYTQSTLSSKAIAEYFDYDRVSVVHSNIYWSAQDGLREWDSVYHAATIVGTEMGLEPQVPLTFKQIGIDGIKHDPDYDERDEALSAGILVTYYDTDFNRYTCLQGVNTLQTNNYVVNTDGTSFSNQMVRIIIQLNKDIVTNSKLQLLGNPKGVNRNTLSVNYLKQWVKTFLESKEATAQIDNILISFPVDKITVTRQQDAYYIRYAVVPNGEITKLFFTGVLI